MVEPVRDTLPIEIFSPPANRERKHDKTKRKDEKGDIRIFLTLFFLKPVEIIVKGRKGTEGRNKP
jgi:hypothetical protein